MMHRARFVRALSSSQRSSGSSKPDSEWIHSEERAVQLTRSERMIMGIAVVSCTAAIAMFTTTKWEVERRVREQLSEADQQKWYEGTYADYKKAEEEAREAEIAGYIAANEFTGARTGMVFKTGPVGLGYYPDVKGS